MPTGNSVLKIVHCAEAFSGWVGGFGGRGFRRGVGRDDKLMSQTQLVTAVLSSFWQCEVGRGQLSKMRWQRDIFHSKSRRALFPHTIFLTEGNSPLCGSILRRIDVGTPHSHKRLQDWGTCRSGRGRLSHTAASWLCPQQAQVSSSSQVASS